MESAPSHISAVAQPECSNSVSYNICLQRCSLIHVRACHKHIAGALASRIPYRIPNIEQAFRHATSVHAKDLDLLSPAEAATEAVNHR